MMCPRVKRVARWCVAAGALLSGMAGVAHAQSVSDDEMLSRAYAALAGGKPAEARRLAEQVLASAPRHHAAATVAVAAASAASASAGLDVYERWLDASRHEDAFALEPVALAVLRALAAVKGPVETDARQVLEASERTGASGQAGDQEGAESGRSIAEQLGRPDSANKVLLLKALARSGYRGATPQVRRLLADPVPDHRAAAADTLAALEATDAIPDLRVLLQDPASEVRASAAAALHRLGDGSGDTLLSDLLASGIPDIQLQAAEAMVNDPPSAWASQILPLLTAEAPMTRLLAARLLLPVEPEQARQVIAGLLADPNPVVVGELARTLAEEGLADLPTIRQLLRHASPEARLQGARALLRLTGGLP